MNACFCRICQRLSSWHTTFTGVKQRLPVWCSVPDYIHGLSLFLSRQTGTWPASHPGFASWENIVEEGISPTSLLAAVITLSITKTKNKVQRFIFVRLLSRIMNLSGQVSVSLWDAAVVVSEHGGLQMVEFLLARLLRKQMDVHISPQGDSKVRGSLIDTPAHWQGWTTVAFLGIDWTCGLRGSPIHKH